MSHPAVFLDRDGTLIRDLHFAREPDQVELISGASAAIRRLNHAGWPVIVVTNQSGIARGFLSTDDFERVQRRTEQLLAADGATLDAGYMCPHHPDFGGPCECRKPGTLLFRQAAKDADLDLARSWYLGDKLRDVLPARELGGHGVLIPSAETPAAELERAREQFEVAPSLDAAVTRILQDAR